MNQRQFEEMEDRIREAAENASPPFSEEHWEEMNLLLDREFPEKRRRRIFFLWFPALLGLCIAGTLTFYFKTGNNKTQPSGSGTDNKIVADKKDVARIHPYAATGGDPENTAQPNVMPSKIAENATRPKTTTLENIENSTTANDDDRLLKHEQSAIVQNKKLNNNHAFLRDNGNKKVVRATSLSNNNTDGNHRFLTGRMLPSNESLQDENIGNILKGRISCLDIVSANPFDKIVVPPLHTFLTKQDDNNSGKNSSKKLSRTRASGFYLIAAGSFVNNSVGGISGKVSGSYGLGLGYRLNSKLSIQTGFYAGKKKYRAGKQDYHFIPGSYFTTVDVTGINADCIVYDIPLSLRYELFSTKKQAFYATAGLSSYIMKRETYDYTYTKSGMSHVLGRTYTGNTHFLSVAGISVGYERRLTNNISLLAEPFIKIPLSGVGEGKVKLHSTGLLLGLKYTLPHK